MKIRFIAKKQLIPRQSQTLCEKGTESHGSQRDSRVAWMSDKKPGYLGKQGGSAFWVRGKQHPKMGENGFM